MPTKMFEINFDGQTIPCYIQYKRMKSITFRLGKDEASLKISCPYFTSDAFLKGKIYEVLPKLRKKVNYQKPINGDYVYIFGKEMHIVGFSTLKEEDRKEYFLSLLLPYCKDRVRLYEEMMGIEAPYQVSVRAMKSRYGVNNRRTHKVTFALSLVHFDPSIIDSVIIHELAHHFVFNHSDAFYRIVFRYCPTYKEKHKKLRDNIYQ